MVFKNSEANVFELKPSHLGDPFCNRILGLMDTLCSSILSSFLLKGRRLKDPTILESYRHFCKYLNTSALCRVSSCWMTQKQPAKVPERPAPATQCTNTRDTSTLTIIYIIYIIHINLLVSQYIVYSL